MKMFTAILAFLGSVGLWLGLIYIFNYALVQEDAVLRSMLPASFVPLYQFFNLMWSSLVFVGILAILYQTINKEDTYG